MAEVARLGFERFANDLEKAWHGGNPSPLEALQNVGRAYLAFARNEPAYYAAMFETGLPKAEDLGLQVGQPGLRRAVYGNKKADRKIAGKHPAALPDGCAAHLGDVARYRFAFRTGQCPSRSAIAPEDLLEAGVLLYLRGLGLAGGAVPDATL